MRRRHEYVLGAPAMQQQQQHQHEQELLLRRRNLIRAQLNANSDASHAQRPNLQYIHHHQQQQQQREQLSCGERRYSLESSPDLTPIYPKFLYRSNMLQTDMLNESLNSLADTELEIYQRHSYQQHQRQPRRFGAGGYRQPQKLHYYDDRAIAHNGAAAAADYDVDVDDDANDLPAVVINTEKVVRNLTAVGRFLEIVQRWPLPRLSFNTACLCFLLAIFIAPRTCAQSIIFPAFRLFFGTLYPAYASYKAVRTKDVKEYVKWMMYWIVYAFFTCIETFTDIFISWFPFYYEVKVIIVLWLLSPATKGSSTLYRKFVHPMLTRREQEIDEYLNQAKERGYSAVLQLGSKGVNYATNVIMQTAIKGGGNLVQTIKRSYSLSDLSEPDVHRTKDEIDEVLSFKPQTRMLRPRLQTPVGRTASGTRHSTGMYFTEVDVTAAKAAGDFNYNIRSSEDISSGYSSAEPGLSRTSSMTNASKTRLKSKRAEDNYGYMSNEREIPSNEADYAVRPTNFDNLYSIDDLREEVFIENKLFYQNLPHTILENSNLRTTDIIDTTKEPLLLPTPEPEHEETQRTLSEAETVKESDDEDCNEDFFEAEASTGSNDNEKLNDELTEATIELQSTILVLDEVANNLEAAAVPIVEAVDVLNDDTADELKLTVSARELRETLEEIKESFRAQIETDDDVTNTTGQSNQQLKVASHNKGRAPAPPLPPRPDKFEAKQETAHVDPAAAAVAVETTTKAGSGSFFKNIKVNVLRRNSSQNQATSPSSASINPNHGRETRI